MYLVYNCGYRSILGRQGPHTRKQYAFKKRFVTKVDDKDGEEFLKLTSKDISWCPTNSKSIPPFMRLKDWCEGKEGRFDSKPFKIYNPKKYLELFLLK